MGNRVFDFIKGIDKISHADCIEIIGTNRAIIENIRSILEYNEQTVRVCLGKKILLLEGSGLKIYNFSNNTIVIDGTIKNISFE